MFSDFVFIFSLFCSFFILFFMLLVFQAFFFSFFLHCLKVVNYLVNVSVVFIALVIIGICKSYRECLFMAYHDHNVMLVVRCE
jgi:hypothetical protein